MKRLVVFAWTMLLACSLAGRAATVDEAKGSNPAEKPYIDVVFAIDCSGSMGPVIETAKKKVWTIVNQIAKAEPSPVLRIGLLGYGNADNSYRQFPLSDDLDTVYKNLMTFKDEGWGSEYVGLAVHKAVKEMPWSNNGLTLKVIYVLGNETARQGPKEMDYTKTAATAWKEGIFVNAIYCSTRGSSLTRRGTINAPNAPANSNAPATQNAPAQQNTPTQQNAPAQQMTPQQKATRSMLRVPAKSTTPLKAAPQSNAPQGTTRVARLTTPVVASNVAPIPEPDAEAITWMEMAQVGHGKFLEIASDGNAIMIATPFDAEVVNLNNALNTTYIPFGRGGREGVVNQLAQDTNARGVGGGNTLASRAYAKSSSQYNNRGWDLVDATKEKDFDWTKLKEEELPEAMRKMTVAERKDYVAKHDTQRAELQKKIRQLGDRRDAYIKEEIKKQGLKTDNSFDEAVRRSITEQAASKGFRFKQ